MEPVIKLKESGIPLTIVIRNPVYGIRKPWNGIQNSFTWGGGGGEIYLPSHGGHGLHTSVSRGGPSLEQSFPPLAGRGLLQNLPRTLNPVLHVLLHSLQADHELYPPSTKEGRDYGKENRNLLLINFDCEVLKHQIPPVASILNHTKGKCFSSNTFLHHGASYAKYDNVFRAQEVKHIFLNTRVVSHWFQVHLLCNGCLCFRY